MNTLGRTLFRMLLGMTPAALLTACSMSSPSNAVADAGGKASSLAQLLPQHQVVLLGEVHDNPDGHRLRWQAMEIAIKNGWRPAIVMEQFDREHQAQLSAAMQSCQDADCVIRTAAPGKSHWHWDYYKPVISLALQYHLPLWAANLSRKDAGRVMRDGLSAVFDQQTIAALGLSHGPDPVLLQGQIDEVVQSHCGMLPKSLHEGMATAQIARDAVMSSIVRKAARNGTGAGKPLPPVALLAGNGHVRRDLGVPRMLTGMDSLSVGITEAPATTMAYDRNFVVPTADRTDPCVGISGKSFRH